MRYVWLTWASLLLIPWLALYWRNPDRRMVMWRASGATTAFGLTEPLFVPEYWDPPTLFDLARRTGFDIESLVFCFAAGGIAVVLYDVIAPRRVVVMAIAERGRHRFHRALVLAPFAAFVPLYFTGWNPIYPALLSLTIGAVGTMICRPDLTKRTLLGGALFLGLYGIVMLGVRFTAPGYIAAAWRLDALSGVLIAGVPLEEFLFGLTFGLYWSAVYEHVTWHKHGAVALSQH